MDLRWLSKPKENNIMKVNEERAAELLAVADLLKEMLEE
jgi:hypothetical protein